jgi:hypothetical protein
MAAQITSAAPATAVPPGIAPNEGSTFAEAQAPNVWYYLVDGTVV